MRFIDLVGKVECRSEGIAEQQPVAVWIGGERHVITELLSDSVAGSVTAGESSYRLLTVALGDGRRLQLRRRLPDGAWRIRRRQVTLRQ